MAKDTVSFPIHLRLSLKSEYFPRVFNGRNEAIKDRTKRPVEVSLPLVRYKDNNLDVKYRMVACMNFLCARFVITNG